jgi:Response regulators consisting of a CheY-like receiver domain and a winged-helix DNA-binding domain
MTELEDPRVIDVLLVEDDEGDVLMTREAFEYYKIQNRLHVVGDGEQALQFLRRTGPYADAPRPGLILLDVNLPRRSGMEVLAELKQDDELLMIPVVMLTTSQAEEDIAAQLLAARQRVHQQARRLRALYRRHPADRQLFPDPRQAAR